MEKIITLLKSNIYEDVYLGLSLLDKLTYKKATIIARKVGAVYKNKYNITWEINTKIENVPKDCRYQYIEGKLYYYSIGDNHIFLDKKKHAQVSGNTHKPYNEFQVIESWK